ncbi:MAG: formate dehydrogenase subunit gamma [Magnetovibrionaceae bacterium]
MAIKEFYSRTISLFAVFMLLIGLGMASSYVLSPTQAVAQTGGAVPGGASGVLSDTEMWRAVRKGVDGTVSIPDQRAATLVQSNGDNLRNFRNGPFLTYSGYALGGILVVLAAFLAIRGRIRIDAGPAGREIERFNELERFAHWLTATSFIVLAITGLNKMYGKIVLMPVVGKDLYASITYFGKLSHNFIGFAFFLGVLLMLVLWLRHNIPNRHDLKWLAVGGGLFSKGVHPPAKKFNAGQKFIFWTVIVGGVSVFLSGLMLMFPYEFSAFAGTFAVINIFGFDLPTTLSPLQETQLALVWHGFVAVVMIVIIVGHIYIGSIGMEGAFDAVSTGYVDENWAREHHGLWVNELKGEEPGGHHAPAE